MEKTECLTPVSCIRLTENNIIEIQLLENVTVELEHITFDLAFCQKLITTNEDYHFLLITHPDSTITTEARIYSSKNMDWATTLSLVSESLAHRLLFNFTSKFMSARPSKMHKTKEDALKWIESQRTLVFSKKKD